MSGSWKTDVKPKRRNNLSRSSLVFRRDGDNLGRLSPGLAILLSALSWPEPECPPSLKPVMVLVATAIWLTVAIISAKFGPSAGFWPFLPVAAAFLLASFVGGSVIAMLAGLCFALGLRLGLINLNMPDLTTDTITSGYRHKDFIMFMVFTWLCGVPHWRRRFSWVFTLLWGLGVVFAPMIYILINVYGFYGELPESIMVRFLNREFLMAWGVTVIVAAVLAKILYLAKDILRRVLI